MTEDGTSDRAAAPASDTVGARPREAVRDYPRPPRLEPSKRRAWVVFGGRVIADTRRALRVLETGHPPLYFFPLADVRREHLVATSLRTWCAFRGMASYFDLKAGDRAAHSAAWQHPWPLAGYEELAGYVAFFPSRVDACYLDNERVQEHDGDAYGGWVTSEIEGPFGGGAGGERASATSQHA